MTGGGEYRIKAISDDVASEFAEMTLTVED
jgi:hypothetical protein